MRYETAVPLGRGGTGKVLKAWDPELERHVAVKLLRFEDPEMVARIKREARLQAKVKHPNVARVYEVGDWEGRPYIAMQLVEGVPIDEALEGLPLERRVEVLATVAEAVQAAHKVGLIHRDLKPGNILVETGDDGTLTPYVVDFGIAREESAEGRTVTGQILGTPGYLAPEQARGETKGLDRRSDVFSLGVVLYEVLTGTRPFRSDSTMEALVQVVEKDPVPPRKRLASLPRDLETIVLKCLEKDPDRRYSSARALGEDLQRFLDGRPIAARPPGRLERLGRRIRRHPLAWGLGAAATAALLLAGGLLLRERYRAAQRVELAQRFGQEIERIDATMDRAHLAPLHDLTPEKAEIESRLEWIEGEMARLGATAEGPGHYALGKGLLALDRPNDARPHLETAWEQGFRTPEVAFALGETLGSLFAEERERALRIRDEERRQQRLREIEGELRDPALDYLALGARAAPGPPSELEGRVAFYEERYEDAIAAAEKAREEGFPWRYEPWILEGRARYEGAQPHFWEGRYDEALAAYERAREALERAADVGRSDPEPWQRLCTSWQHVLEVHRATGESIEEPYRRSVEACDRALTADPLLASAWEKTARGHWRWSEELRKRGKDPVPTLDRAIEAASRAEAADPSSHLAPNLEALARWVKARYQRERGTDPGESIAAGVEAARRSLDANPRYRHAHNSLGLLQLLRADELRRRGEDAREAFETAARAFQGAAEVDPSYIYAYNNRAIALHHLAELAFEAGEDPTPHLDRALDAIDRALEHNPRYANAWEKRATTHLRRAHFILQTGGDPGPDLDEADEALDRALEIDPSRPNYLQNRAVVHLRRAKTAIRDGGDPSPHLARTRSAADAALELNPAHPSAPVTLGEADLLAAEHALAEERDPSASLRRARSRFRELLDLDPGSTSALAGMAETRLLEARSLPPARGAEALERARVWISRLDEATKGPEPRLLEARLELERARLALASGRSPLAAVEAGLAAATDAASTRPGDPDAIRIRAELHLARARWRILRGEDPDPELAAGAELAERALQRNPKDHRARAVLTAARAVGADGVAGAAGDDAGTAGAALARHLEHRPELRPDFEPWLELSDRRNAGPVASRP